jgi:NADH:ubiquinone oxidoreductase subunit E
LIGRAYNDGLIFDDLRAIQKEHGYLPAGEIEALSKRTGVSLPHIHGVADFYPHFFLTPPPKVIANVCMDMTCHLPPAGSAKPAGDPEAALWRHEQDRR